jgi:predicted nucleotidyltransferase component of viral defense system
MRKSIELFHIFFSRSLLTMQDKSLFALKGGCNLRFFMGSNRYSEDIDFDVETISKSTLQRRIDKTLESQGLRNMLATRKIEILSSSAPKQTETVQRWKVMLRVAGLSVPTKIEFSRRGIDREGASFDPIDPLVLADYQLSPMYMTHYVTKHAVIQKIEALAGRAETQARDVYDLNLLFSRGALTSLKLSQPMVQKAIECAMSVDFDQFRGQVVEFLFDDARAYFLDRANWDRLQNFVITTLEGVGK